MLKASGWNVAPFVEGDLCRQRLAAYFPRGSPCARSLSSGISKFGLESQFPDYGFDITSSIALKTDVKRIYDEVWPGEPRMENKSPNIDGSDDSITRVRSPRLFSTMLRVVSATSRKRRSTESWFSLIGDGT